MSSSDLPSDDEYRRQIYEVRGDPDLSLAEKLERLLVLGCEYLGVENGHIKRIDEDAGVHEVLVATGGELVFEGDLYQHATTYCRKTIQRDTPLAVANAAEGWADDPAYRTHELACYLGATITLRGDPFGTVCFVDREGQSETFGPSERAFVELLASMVSSELESLRHEHRLGDHEYVIGVLNRVLRHNLRNSMAAVAGFAEILTDHLEGDRRALAERIRESAYEMVELGNTARRLEGVVTDPGPSTGGDLPGLVAEVVDALREGYPAADLSVQGPADQRALMSPALGDALFELGENAIVHSGDDPTVEFGIEAVTEGAENRTVVSVSDDGPGLPPTERRLLQGEHQTPLDHGNGLGLLLVYWAVRRTDGDIEVTVDDGTTVSIALPMATEGARRPPWTPFGLAGEQT